VGGLATLTGFTGAKSCRTRTGPEASPAPAIAGAARFCQWALRSSGAPQPKRDSPGVARREVHASLIRSGTAWLRKRRARPSSWRFFPPGSPIQGPRRWSRTHHSMGGSGPVCLGSRITERGLGVRVFHWTNRRRGVPVGPWREPRGRRRHGPERISLGCQSRTAGHRAGSHPTWHAAGDTE